MRTTTDVAAVAVKSFEQQLNDLFLGARDSLPRGLNGRAATPPPKHIASTRKMMGQGLCRPFKHIIEVGDEMIDADVPYTEVNAALARIMARNQARALDRHIIRDRPIPVLLLKTQKEMGELSLASLRLAHSPESVEAIEAVLREAADLPPVVEALERSCHLEIVRSSTRSSGRRMEVSR